MSEIKPIILEKPVEWQPTFKNQEDFIDWICGYPYSKNIPKPKKVNILK
jgi:hypothetical protein